MDMKKSIFLVVGLLCFQGIAQKSSKKSKVLAQVICECLENTDSQELAKDPDEVFNSCYKSGVFAAAISAVDKGKDSTITFKADGSSDTEGEKENKEALAILDKKCEIFQELSAARGKADQKVVAVSESSCGCIENISTSLSLEGKGEAIKGCITSTISELRDELGIEITTVEEIRDFYGAVNAYLVDQCEAVAIVAFSDDQEKLNSYSGNDKAMAHYDKGQEYYLKNDFKKAIKHYQKATQEDPKFVFAWDNLGRSYRETNQLDKAINAYQKSIAIDSLNRTALMNIAVAYNYKKEFNHSEYWYKKLIEVNNQDPEGHYGIALSYLYQNQLEQSLNSIIKAHQLYAKIGSPYVADAKKVMRYLEELFTEADKIEGFKNRLKESSIMLN